jgi:Transposase, Mutator family
MGSSLRGAAWQFCRAHLLCNVLATVPRAHAEMVAAAIRTFFAQGGSSVQRYVPVNRKPQGLRPQGVEPPCVRGGT